MIELRPYQRRGDRRLSLAKRRPAIGAIILVAPTGAGKTVIGADIINSNARAEFGDVLVLAHRREIITQTSDKLYATGSIHGIIQAGFQPRPLERVQVASIQTLYRRASKRARWTCRRRICW